MTHHIGVSAGKAQTKVKMQLNVQQLEEVAKLKAEQGGKGLIHPVLPFIPRRCDGQPRGPSVTEITSAASPAVPLPTSMNLPLGIKFNIINPEWHIQA